jgi:hypothetical protein
MSINDPDLGPENTGRPAHASWRVWRDRIVRAGVGLLTIFVGVTAAFFVDGYRDGLAEQQQLRDTRLGIITELKHYEQHGTEIADDIDKSIARWQAADAAGKQAVPGYYLMKGAPHPPSAAWTSAVASGVASHFDPQTQMDLGYFYSEFIGIHENYLRRLEFTEQDIMPKELLGPGAFYDASGKLLPQYRVHMQLLARFNADLRRLTGDARKLRLRLEEQDRNENPRR